MPRDTQIPKGLRFFHTGASQSYRRNRLVFACLMAMICLSIAWPVYPLFSGIYPLIFGFPLSFAWIIFALLISMVALVILYRSDKNNSSDNEV